MSSGPIELNAYGPVESEVVRTGDDSLLGNAGSHPNGRPEVGASRDSSNVTSRLFPALAGRGRSDSVRRSGNARRFPLFCVCLLGVPVLLITLAWGITYKTAPELLPKINLPTLTGASTETLESRCLCGTESKRETEGQRVCEVYGKSGLLRSRLHTGSGNRIRRMIDKAVSGEKLKIGILGGSVSACHGVHPDPEWPAGDPSGPGCYSTLLMEWLHKAFPLKGDDTHELMNGAIGGMDSSYYAFCGTQHIPTDVDLIILEFDVNDQATQAYQAFFDQLLRVLLELPSQPAVVILGAWSPNVAQDQGYGDPQIAHLPVAHYYDIPYLSLKRMVWNHYLRWPKETKDTFWIHDGLHPNARGHRIMADLLVSYFESQICEYETLGLPTTPPQDVTLFTSEPFSDFISVPFPFDSPHAAEKDAPEGWEKTFDNESIARMAFEPKLFVDASDPYSVPWTPIEQPLRDVVDPTKPDPGNAEHITGIVQPKLFCADANDPVNPMAPVKSEGWRKYVWKAEKHYWLSDTPKARIRVDIKVAQGRVAVYYWRSKTVAGGTARCWVDDNTKGAVTLKTWWSKPYNVASVEYIDEKVTPGDHYVECELMDESSNPADPTQREFRLVAIMAT